MTAEETKTQSGYRVSASGHSKAMSSIPVCRTLFSAELQPLTLKTDADDDDDDDGGFRLIIARFRLSRGSPG
ncbi:uncharacterized protein V6R79_013779 [Siganus canaliculatus]